MDSKIYDLIIIGSGPAGMAAGIYAGRQGIKTLIISKDTGGQIGKKAVFIENYPGFEKITGQELIEKFYKQAEVSGAEFAKDEVKEVRKNKEIFEIIVSGDKKYQASAVIIASGSDPRPLEAKGEKEFLGKGLSYCALCDGPIFKNKEVAIVGGGNAALETARFLLSYVKKIYILECSSSLKAEKINQDIVMNSGKAEAIFNVQVKEIKGDKFVSGLVYNNKESGEDKELSVGGIFIEIGYQPATSFVKELVDFSEKDEIMVDPETCQTKTAGLFAAGDVNSGKCKQIITAAGEGAKAAIAAYGYLTQNKFSV
jgi:thioredoxin-disulfide reductase